MQGVSFLVYEVGPVDGASEAPPMLTGKCLVGQYRSDHSAGGFEASRYHGASDIDGGTGDRSGKRHDAAPRQEDGARYTSAKP